MRRGDVLISPMQAEPRRSCGHLSRRVVPLELITGVVLAQISLTHKRSTACHAVRSEPQAVCVMTMKPCWRQRVLLCASAVSGQGSDVPAHPAGRFLQ